MSRGKQTDVDVEQQIIRLALEGYGGAQIHRRLTQDKRFEGRVPDVRTIQRSVKDVRAHDASGTWGLGDADGETARLVLETLATVIRRSGGRIPALSRAEAEWIARIRKAVPDLHPWAAYAIALRYLKYAEDRTPTTPLDVFLALAPWRSERAARAYAEHVERLGETDYYLRLLLPIFRADLGDAWELFRDVEAELESDSPMRVERAAERLREIRQALQPLTRNLKTIDTIDNTLGIAASTSVGETTERRAEDTHGDATR